MKDPKIYTTADRATVAELALLLTPFLTQVVPPLPHDPLVQNRAWRRHIGDHVFDPWEYAVDPTLTQPFISAAVALEDLSMAFRETLTVNPLTHNCRYLTSIKNHEHLMIIMPSHAGNKSEPTDPDISVVAFSSSPWLYFAKPFYARRAAALCYGYLLFRATEMDLVNPPFIERLEEIRRQNYETV